MYIRIYTGKLYMKTYFGFRLFLVCLSIGVDRSIIIVNERNIIARKMDHFLVFAEPAMI